MSFPDTVLAAVAGETVHLALLLEFDFASGTQRFWLGYGNLKTADGAVWKGLGELGTINGLDQAINGSAPKCDITISEVTPYGVRVATDSWTEARGRGLAVSMQFFTADAARMLDAPCVLNRFTMEQITVNFKGPTLREITVTCESKFSARGFPIHGWLSDRDQQSRFPGDRGCERIPILQYHVVTWPRA